MKKIIILCVLLSLTCISVSAKEHNDSLPTKEIEFLNNQNIIVGDPDGDLRETDEITRAEFVTVLCRAIGIENLAESEEMKNKTIYVDVPCTHWAVGYINAATEKGAINGVGNGFFCPEKPVKNEEVIKILVAAWGYTDEAEELGGYPNGYMAVSKSFGITDSVLFNYGNASKRWVVSVFTYNMLSVKPKSVGINPTTITKIEKAEKPIGENGTEYIQNPYEFLEKITPETIRYERKIFEQRVPENMKIPVNLMNGIVEYDGNTKFDSATLSIGKVGEKDNVQIDLSKSSEINISTYDNGEYQIISSLRINNVVDTYYTDLIISGGTAMLGETFRITYLRHQPIIEDNSEEILIDSNSYFNIPFDIKADVDSAGKIVMCINYPNVLFKGEAFEYDIVSPENETVSEKIDGKNEIIEPIIIDNLKLDSTYNISIGVTQQNGSHDAVKGSISFYKENNTIKFKISGNHSIIVFKGYKIGD